MLCDSKKKLNVQSLSVSSPSCKTNRTQSYFHNSACLWPQSFFAATPKKWKHVRLQNVSLLPRHQSLRPQSPFLHVQRLLQVETCYDSLHSVFLTTFTTSLSSAWNLSVFVIDAPKWIHPQYKNVDYIHNWPAPLTSKSQSFSQHNMWEIWSDYRVFYFHNSPLFKPKVCASIVHTDENMSKSAECFITLIYCFTTRFVCLFSKSCKNKRVRTKS